MKYLCCEKQQGEGCDYTIGCGMRYWFLEASSIEDAIEQCVFPDGIEEESALEGEMALKEIFLVPAEHITIVDIDGFLKKIKAVRKRQSEDKQRAKDLAELKRLQAKYGG